MKKFIFSMMLFSGAFSLTASAQVGAPADDEIYPTPLENIVESPNWRQGWFFSVQGGLNSFIGKPVGHEDLFGRISPSFHANIGKWITPSVGVRIGFDGLKLKDSDIQSRSFQNLHADFLYNVASVFQGDKNKSRLVVAPYLGLGLIRNSFTKEKPFALNGGFSVGYKITRRVALAADGGLTTTFQEFDGKGKRHAWGDRLIHLTTGMTVLLGKTEWKTVTDPKPYIVRHETIVTQNTQLREKNEVLERQHTFDQEAIGEMKKILKIEGLLSKYNLEEGSGNKKEKNNYSGLNSLRERMKNGAHGGIKEEGDKNTVVENFNNEKPEVVGTPVFFFFDINKTTLREEEQFLNIEALAKVAIKHDLLVKVVGAADQKTGTEQRNSQLALQRAGYIAKLLVKKGVAEKNIAARGEGGIDTYKPSSANRNTCVFLYRK